MTLKQLEETVTHLPPDELACFREWFLDFGAQYWDAQIEADTNTGWLDRLADATIVDHRAGRTTAL